MRALLSTRYLLALTGSSIVAALAVGIPTDVVPNPWFTRMTPVRTLDVVLLPIMSVAIGSVLATYALPSSCRTSGGLSAGGGSGLLGVFAVGCPVCNKLVVLALGFSGALTYFEPIQPVLGVGAIALSAVALRARLLAVARDSGMPVRLDPSDPSRAPSSDLSRVIP